MTNIQKEISQLEHWLNNLSDESHETPRQQVDVPSLHRVLDRLTDEVGNQRNTLNNILERLDHLEGFSRPDREVFIDEPVKNKSDPWLDDDCLPFENEVVQNNSEPVITVHKNIIGSSSASVATPSIIPDVPEDHSLPPDIDDTLVAFEGQLEEETTKVELPVKKEDAPIAVAMPFSVTINLPTISIGKKEVVEVIKEKQEEVEVVEVVEEEEEEEEEVEVVEEEQEEEEVEVVEEEEEEEVEIVEEEEEEEEDEEGLELEELTYKGVKYYMDGEGFIYTIDDEEQPSENPVGYWKGNTKSIAFYKTK